MLAHSLPPDYERKKPIPRPKLGPWLGIIDQILEEDESQPKNNATLQGHLGIDHIESVKRVVQRGH
jgi:hypothetical protein